ncbi:MAG: DEAD/DEAH box helicase [Acidimicrobiia bacterium]|jgi:superfamily II DNA/RNA helicase|nr:MAG: DEAD/DEAH box helicase [Acidimicrobiia bacterium]
MTSSQQARTDVRFDDLGLADPIVEVLTSKGFAHPFPIQADAIPDALSGADLCGKAKTGSGKTFAFGLPVIQQVVAGGGLQALILVPTRELCAQVASELRPFAKAMGVSVVEVYGGVSMQKQIDGIEAGAEVIVATPGRLIDLQDREAVAYDQVKMVVLDEADQMGDMGFMPQVEYIWRQVPDGHQSMLFSATLDGAIDHLIRRRLTNPVRHEVASDTVSVEQMEHRFLLVHHRDKLAVAARVAESAERVLVFTQTKRMADRVAGDLRDAGVQARAIHGDLPQAKRQQALDRFTEGKTPVLVATNVAARGLDIDDVDLVIHYDPPSDAKTFLHRSGRTARAGRSGMVVTLTEWDQETAVQAMQREAELDHEIVKMYSSDDRLDDLWAWEPPRRAPEPKRSKRRRRR